MGTATKLGLGLYGLNEAMLRVTHDWLDVGRFTVVTDSGDGDLKLLQMSV